MLEFRLRLLFILYLPRVSTRLGLASIREISAYGPKVNCELHMLTNSHVSAASTLTVSTSSQSPAAPAQNMAGMKWSSVAWAARYWGCFMSRAIARRKRGPLLCTIASSVAWRKSSAHFSGGVSWPRLSRYSSIGAQWFRYRLCTAPPVPIRR